MKFESGADRGQKMMSFTDAKKKNNKHSKGCAHTRGLVLYKRMMNLMLKERKWVPFLGCEIIGEKIINKLTKRPLHYRDIADQMIGRKPKVSVPSSICLECPTNSSLSFNAQTLVQPFYL